MADDIVTRLRWFTCEELNCESDVLCAEAADEIEQLRKTMQMMVLDYRTQIVGLKLRCTCKENQNGI